MVDRKEEANTTRDTEQVELDKVNSPPHYNNGGMECIDYIQQTIKQRIFFLLSGQCDKISSQMEIQRQWY